MFGAHLVRIVTTALIVGSLALTGCAKKPAAAAAGKAKAAVAVAAGAPAAASAVDPTAAPEGAKVMFISPVDGAALTGELKDGKVTVHVQMGAEGIKVEPAGAVVPGSGHHHIIIDADATPLGTSVPADGSHIHYGKGQTETDLQLAPGTYKLTLQFANGVHQSYGPKLASTIKVTVAAAAAPHGAAADAPAANPPTAAAAVEPAPVGAQAAAVAAEAAAASGYGSADRS